MMTGHSPSGFSGRGQFYATRNKAQNFSNFSFSCFSSNQFFPQKNLGDDQDAFLFYKWLYNPFHQFVSQLFLCYLKAFC